MKKVILVLIALTLFSCGYHKEEEVSYNTVEYHEEYRVWVYYNLELLEGFSAPTKGITLKKRDSVDNAADEYIIKHKILLNRY